MDRQPSARLPMIQDIAPHRYQVAYAPCPPQESSRCFLFRGRAILEREVDGQLTLPTWGELGAALGESRWLFRIDETDYYLCTEGGKDPLPLGYAWYNLREHRAKKSRLLRFAESTAYHLSLWYQDNQFCGRCGGETQPDDRERMLRCPHCGNLIYPKIAPAVIVAVTDGDRILMTRYQGRVYKGYALIAGFTEIGETAEDTVRREVMEEVGLQIKSIRYYGSQPWGVDSNLLLGFFAQLDGTGEIHMDRQELSQAGWYRREEIDLAPDGYSLTNHMIQAFREGTW